VTQDSSVAVFESKKSEVTLNCKNINAIEFEADSGREQEKGVLPLPENRQIYQF